jgi:hypothetical protein
MVKTFGDSTKTPGQFAGERCYILAQFSETSNVDWARDLRAVLGGSELKYGKYISLRHLVQKNKALWQRVLSGTSEATIVVIENSFYIDAIVYRLKSEGAEFGHDITFDDMLKEAALCMISHAPVMRLVELASFGLGIRRDIGGTFTPEAVFTQLGSKLNDAAIFATRAHASFDIDGLSRASSTNEMFTAPHRGHLFFEVNKMERVFDKEHPKSAKVLNEIFSAYDKSVRVPTKAHVIESSSHSQDELQAADFTAGFASEIMMNAKDNPERDLRQHFRRVIFNGAAK